MINWRWLTKWWKRRQPDRPAERFVYLTTYHPGLGVAVQQTIVMDRQGFMASEYILWLN